MDDKFLSVVECNPFNTKQLQELIQRRHKTSGLTYVYRNETEETVSLIKIASLFNNYFLYSHGIPGVAMNAWLGNITKVTGHEIFISSPKYPNHEVLKSINPDWLIVVVMFVQHKNMSVKKLSRVMAITFEDAENIINILVNARILECRDTDVYTLNRFLEPFLVNAVVEMGII
jgi:hypothetical protein